MLFWPPAAAKLWWSASGCNSVVECLLPKQKVVGSSPITRSIFVFQRWETMALLFERGDRDLPVGHALIYWRADDGSILATYVSVPPIPFDPTPFIPPMLAGALEGFDLGNATAILPIPPIPQQVASVEYLQSLAAHRQDDLIYGGPTTQDPMRLAADASQAAAYYGELYGAGSPDQAPQVDQVVQTVPQDTDAARFADMTEQERLNELSMLTGRLRDSMLDGGSDPEVERQMRVLVDLLPAKYRAQELIDAALEPGERGLRLAQLYLQRCFKLYNEEYLDLERIDQEIEAARG